MEWDSDSIVIHNWPKLEQLSDGRWKRVWNILLKDIAKKDILISKIEKELSTNENKVFLSIEDNKKITMEVYTNRWGWDDELYFYSYQLLRKIDDHFGTILKIQGQDRDLWNPWLNKKLDEEL